VPDPLLLLLPYAAILGALSVHGLHRLYLSAVYARVRAQAPQAGPPGALPLVTVQLPIFNERNVVERLVDAACRLDWPADRLEIQVLDDSTDDTTAVAEAVAASWRARGIEVRVLHRADRCGYKAGALAHGLSLARGEFIAVFDADFVPTPQFLRQVLPHFAEGVGMVQARWGHLNEGQNLLTRLAAVMLDGHFVVEHTARNRSGRFFNFNGTAGVWRRACIEAAGGWQHDTLTEDLDLSYRAQLAGWRFVFLRDEVVPAELPADIRAFKLQQHRWAKGTMQTARKLLPQILRAPLPARVKLESLVHLASNLAWPLVLALALLMPLAVLARGQGELSRTLVLDLPVFLLSTGGFGLFYALAARDASPADWRGRLWRIPLAMALGIGMSINQTRAVVEGLFGKDLTFLRTPKAGDRPVRSYVVAAGIWPWAELLMAAWMLIGIAACAAAGLWASLPFLTLFGVGFLMVGFSGLRPA